MTLFKNEANYKRSLQYDIDFFIVSYSRVCNMPHQSEFFRFRFIINKTRFRFDPRGVDFLATPHTKVLRTKSTSKIYHPITSKEQIRIFIRANWIDHRL